MKGVGWRAQQYLFAPDTFYLLTLKVVLGRYTEIPNRNPIFWNTYTDTDVGIHNIDKYRISTIKYRKYRKTVRYLPPEIENFITERAHVICRLNFYTDVIYNLNIVDSLFTVLDVVLHCIRVQLVIASYVYSNNHNAANNNDLSAILPGSRDYKFPDLKSRDWKKTLGFQNLISPTRLPNIWLKYLQP